MDLSRLAHYEITGQLGAGGMGEVYRARDSKLGRDVALKLLPDAFARDPDRLARFEREARLLASLNHPHIAAIYGLEEDTGKRFLVLEYVEGEDLSRRLASGRIPVEDALGIAQQVCEALEAAHDAGVVHRDLKPGNIIVTPGGSVKVLDFGLAKALDPATNASNLTQSPTILGSSPTMQGVILGTAAYMSPEQARGRTVDRRADIFAFGCVLYEMLTGRQAFSGDTVSDTLAAVLRADIDWSLLPAETPSAVKHLLKRCLEKDPKRRLRDIGEATLILDDVRTGRALDEPVAVGAATVGSRRFLGPRAIALALALVAIVAAASSTLTRILGDPGNDAPVRKFHLSMAAEDSLGAATDPRLSPDGTRLAYHLGGKVWVRDLDNLTPRMIAPANAEIAPFWSPDGAWIGFASTERIFKSSAASGEVTVVCDVPEVLGGGAGAAWSDHGTIVFCSGSSGIYEVSANGGDAKEVVAIDSKEEQDFHVPCALPGGAIIAVQHRVRFGPDTIILFKDGTRRTILTVDGANLLTLNYSDEGYVLFSRVPDNSGLWALPFSLDRLEPTGDAFLVASVASAASTAAGTLVYQPSMTSDAVRFAWIDQNGNRISYATEPLSVVNSAALSPDGTRLAVSGRTGATRDIRIVDLERGSQSRLTFMGNYNLLPAWSPDGTRVAYRDQDEGSVYVVSADGTGERVLACTDCNGPVYSPDGTRLLVSSTAPGRDNMDLYLVGVAEGDTTKVPFLIAPGNQRTPTFSPDGRYVAYLSDESGTQGLYLTKFPEATGRWQVSVAGSATWPRWSPQGGPLYFRNDTAMMMVDIETGTTPRLGTPREVASVEDLRMQMWGGNKIGVSPDGKRLLIPEMIVSGDRSSGIVLIDNWVREFTAAP